MLGATACDACSATGSASACNVSSITSEDVSVLPPDAEQPSPPLEGDVDGHDLDSNESAGKKGGLRQHLQAVKSFWDSERKARKRKDRRQSNLIPSRVEHESDSSKFAVPSRTTYSASAGERSQEGSGGGDSNWISEGNANHVPRAALCGPDNWAAYGSCVASTFRRLEVSGMPIAATPAHAGLPISISMLKLDAYDQVWLTMMSV